MNFALRRYRTAATALRAPASAAERGRLDAPPAGPHVGLVTRALAFSVDAALVNLVALLVAAVVTVSLSVLSLPEELRTVAAAVGGAVYLVWTVGYFATFWSTTGQTPGNRIFAIRVCPASGDRLPPRRAVLRFAGLTLAALPLFAGFLLILVDDRRRGLHDRMARTVVVEAPEEPPADTATGRWSAPLPTG